MNNPVTMSNKANKSLIDDLKNVTATENINATTAALTESKIF